MNRTQVTVRRIAAFFLLTAAFAGQWVGLSRLQKLAHAATAPVILQADVPLPPPPPTPIKQSQS